MSTKNEVSNITTQPKIWRNKKICWVKSEVSWSFFPGPMVTELVVKKIVISRPEVLHNDITELFVICCNLDKCNLNVGQKNWVILSIVFST